MEAGYLGVGAMGLPMATKLLDGGHRLTVLDINDDAVRAFTGRQCPRATTPRELADRHEIVFVSLPTIGAYRHVVFGDNGLLRGDRMKILVNTCTVGMPFLREVEAAMALKGVTIIDCPISGGPAGARAGALSVMVSGAPDAIEAVRPMISLWGQTLTVCGDRPGPAQVLKLTNNILFAVSLAATCEAFVMGAKGGLDPEVMMTAIGAGSGANRAQQMVFAGPILSRRFNMGGAMHILVKDVDLALELADELGIPMWVCQAARLVFKHAMFEGRGNDDISTIVQVIERGAKFEIPKTR